MNIMWTRMRAWMCVKVKHNTFPELVCYFFFFASNQSWQEVSYGRHTYKRHDGVYISWTISLTMLPRTFPEAISAFLIMCQAHVWWKGKIINDCLYHNLNVVNNLAGTTERVWWKRKTTRTRIRNSCISLALTDGWAIVSFPRNWKMADRKLFPIFTLLWNR